MPRLTAAAPTAASLAATPLPLLGILLLALVLRTWGLAWGLPSATHYFSYHPDESRALLVCSPPTMNVFAGRLLPHFYNYGSLQLYLVCFANTAAMLAGAVDIVPKDYAVWYPQWAKMYLIGRSLTVGMGVGTVLAVYRIGERLWGRRAGLLAALTLAVMPLHAQHSHFLTVDVPATFWAMLSLLWAVRLATEDPKPLRAALWAGVFAGLAAATKYNLALAVLPLVAACILTRQWKGLALGVPMFVLAFLAACPGVVLENAAFLRDLRFEAVHVQNTEDPTFRDTGSGFVYHVARNLDAGLGLPLLLLALVSVGYALYRRGRGDGLLAAFALPYYVLIGLAAVRYARYTLPLLPVLALWVGRMAADWSRATVPVRREMGRWASALVLGLTLVWCVRLVGFMADQDMRDWALRFINAPKDGGRSAALPTVGFAAQPWFGTPPVSPYFSLPGPGGWRRLVSPQEASRIVYEGKDWDAALLEARKPDLVVLSEYDYADALRLKDPAALHYLEVLRREYQRSYVLVDNNSALSTQYASIEGLPTRGWPHDMLYACPIISLYKRKP